MQNTIIPEEHSIYNDNEDKTVAAASAAGSSIHTYIYM